jgi:hypothetical protein
MGHSVGDQAKRSVDKGAGTKKKEARTDEQVLKDIANNLDARLAVPPDDVRFLLSKYNSAQNAVAHLGQSTSSLLKRAETAEEEIRALKGLKESLSILKNPDFVNAVAKEGFKINEKVLEQIETEVKTIEGASNGN